MDNDATSQAGRTLPQARAGTLSPSDRVMVGSDIVLRVCVYRERERERARAKVLQGRRNESRLVIPPDRSTASHILS